MKEIARCRLELVGHYEDYVRAIHLIIRSAMYDFETCVALYRHCGPELLKRAFANILENAFKYSRDADEPRIHLGSYDSDGSTVYFVRDNALVLTKNV